MTPKTELLAAITRLSRSKNALVSESVLDTYVDLLSDLPVSHVAAACGRLAAVETFGFPQVGKIRQEVINGTLGDITRRALEAWAAVLKACRQGGAWRDVQFEDPAIGEALRVAVGTWPHMCALSSDTFEFSKVRETFLEMYAKYGATPRGGSVTLRGLSERAKVHVVPRIDGLTAAELPTLDAPTEARELNAAEASAALADITKRIADRKPVSTSDQRLAQTRAAGER